MEVGDKFERWTIIHNGGKNVHRQQLWVCQCECDNVKTVLETSLKRGQSKSCGCLQKEKAIQTLQKINSGNPSIQIKIGDKFGRWEVIEPHSQNEVGQSWWRCKCKCGTERIVIAASLKNGGSKSCGCLKKETSAINARKMPRNISENPINIGDKFGRLTVVQYISHNKDGHSLWLCQCKCGNTKQVYAQHLKKGGVKSCGCLHKEITSPRILEIMKERYGDDNSQWKGKRYKLKNGYLGVLIPIGEYHPKIGSTRFIMEHILVMEKYLGRFLTKEETVHHKNGIRHDNRIENLELWSQNHCGGQRVDDLIKFAEEVFEKYSPEKLNQNTPCKTSYSGYNIDVKVVNTNTGVTNEKDVQSLNRTQETPLPSRNS